LQAQAALLNDIQRKRALAAANEIDAEKKLPYRDVPPDGLWKKQAVKAKAQVTPTPTPPSALRSVPHPIPNPTPPPYRTPTPMSPKNFFPTQFSTWIPRGYPDPDTIPQIPLALSRGGSIDIPHASSVVGLNLLQWGSTFSASSSAPAKNLGELDGILDKNSEEFLSSHRTVRVGPLSFSGEKNIFGMTDYEIGLHFGSQKVIAPNGVTVEFSHSIAFRGESMGSGLLNRVVTIEYNFLDYTAESSVPSLPANSASAGVYLKISPLRLALVAIIVLGAVLGVSQIIQIIQGSPLGDPIPVFQS